MTDEIKQSEDQDNQSIMTPEVIQSSDFTTQPTLPPLSTFFKSIGTEAEEEALPAPQKRYAVFIAHGMGQQVPYETIDVATQGLRRVIDKVDGISLRDDKVRTRAVRIGTQVHERAEFDLNVEGEEGTSEKVEVHVYEAYWAPITEGQVKLKDVMSFLLQGFWGGIRNSFKSLELKHWIFEKEVPMKRNQMAAFYFLLTGLIIFSLVALNALTGLIAAARIFSSGQETWLQGGLLTILTFVAATLSIILLFYGISLRLVQALSTARQEESPGKLRTIFSSLLWIGFWICCAVVILAGLAFLIFTAIGYISPSSIYKLVTQPPFTYFPFLGKELAWIIVWGFLFWVTYRVKKLLVQYPGDVAAYISSFKLDQFAEIRKKIKAATFDVLDTIYTATENNHSYYERVGLMGHSLGSVVVYDALNAVITKDVLNNKENNVSNRTKVLVTFGSPLDKTAYIFSAFATGTTSIREKLATTKQPLIQDYKKYRNFKWVNIYSKRDIISGKLDYYDWEDDKNYTEERRIDNKEDPNAITPLVAHVEYWKNDLVFVEFLNGLIEK